jgi:putative transposase
MGLRGAIRGTAARCPLDHNRQFYAPALDRPWLAEFAYFTTWAGFLYVAFVIDDFARRIVGCRARRMAPPNIVLETARRSLRQSLNRWEITRGADPTSAIR